MAWAPLTAFGEGTAVLALRPTSATMDKAFICTTGGTTGATEPNWLGSSPITDGTCIWQAAPSFNTGCDLLKVDKLQIAGHTLDILDMPSGATWQVYYQAVCAERT